MTDAENDLGHLLALSDVTNTILNASAFKMASGNEKIQVNSHHKASSLPLGPEPSPHDISLPPISNLFEIAGTANGLDCTDSDRTFDDELLKFPSLPWPEFSAGSTTLLPRLPSPHPLLALGPNQHQDLRTCRTVPLPPASPLHSTFEPNQDQLPYEPFAKNQQYNNLEMMLYDHSSQPWGLPSTEYTQEVPRVYYEETSRLFADDDLGNLVDQAALLPRFQSSSSSLYNALGLTFLPPLVPAPRIPTRTSRSRIKNKSSKPLIQCQLCPKAFTSSGMSRHLAWHRRRGDAAKKLAQNSSDPQQSSTHYSAPGALPTVPDAPGLAPDLETQNHVLDTQSPFIYVPKPVPFPVRPCWIHSPSVSFDALPHSTQVYQQYAEHVPQHAVSPESVSYGTEGNLTALNLPDDMNTFLHLPEES